MVCRDVIENRKMPELVTKYKIFLASPSDLADERASIDDVINELNQTFGVSNNVVLELIKWETHAAPGINKKDSQEVINQDIGNDYDVFIGILWTKFGTPTKSSNSGTEEEFKNAYNRFQKESDSLQILFYFKTSTPNSLSDINPNQLEKVQNFKNTLGEKSTLYWEYTTIDELLKFLRIHIPKRVNQLIKQSETKSEIVQKSPVSIEEELGLIDYQEIIEEGFANSTKAVERIADSVTWVGEEITKKTEEANSLSSRENVANKVLRDFFRRTAKILNDFADRIDPDINIFISNFEEGADAVSQLISISKNDFEEFDQGDFDTALDALIKMDKGLNSGLQGVFGFLEAVKGLPRMAKELNKARRNVESKLELLVSKMEISLSLSDELQKELQ